MAVDRGEAGAGGAADSPPGVEGSEEVAEDGREEGEAEPAGDEEEGEGEVAVRGFGAFEAGVNRNAEEEDADGAAHDLQRQPEEHCGEALPQRPSVLVLELRLPPGRREGA